MKSVWIARILPKPRNRLSNNDYGIIEADSPEQLLRKLLKIKHRAFFELERIELVRKKDAVLPEEIRFTNTSA